MKAHQKIGPVTRQLCTLFDAIIIGGGVAYMADNTGKVKPPKDIDVVVPIDRWVQASKLIPNGAIANSFGGFKFQDGPLEVDVWADDALRIFCCNKHLSFYCMRNEYSLIYKGSA